MVVARIGAGFVMEFAHLPAGDRKPPRHAEMHDKDLVGRKLERQEFCLAAKVADMSACEALGEPVRKRKSQICPVLDKPVDALALHDRGQSAANCLDFGQFRHGNGI